MSLDAKVSPSLEPSPVAFKPFLDSLLVDNETDPTIFSRLDVQSEEATRNLTLMLESSEDEIVWIEKDVLYVIFEKPTAFESVETVKALIALLVSDHRLEGVKTIHCIHCRFSTSAFGHFSEGLNSVERISSLTFQDCDLNAVQASLLLNPSNPRLLSLKISAQTISNPFLVYLKIFLESNPALQKLFLEECRLTDADVQLLAEGLLKNKNLVGLYLGRNNMTDRGVLAIAWMLRSHPAIRELSLRENFIGDIGAMALGQTLHDRIAPPLNLGLEDNPITGSGAEYLVGMGKGLCMLGLKDIRQIKTLDVLDRVVKRKAIEALSLSGTGVTDEAVRNFISNSDKKPRVDPDCRLKEVHVSQTTLSAESIEELKRYFKDTSVNVLCDQITSDDSLHASLITDIMKTPKPEMAILERILKIKNPGDRQILFGLLLTKHFKLISIPRDGNCLFTSITEGLNNSGPFMAFKFLVEYLDKYKNDLKDIVRDFDKLTMDQVLRQIAVHYIETHPDDFKPFMLPEEQEEVEFVADNQKPQEDDLDKRFKDYCKNMKNPGTFGDEIVIQALMGVFREFNIPRGLVVLNVFNAPSIVDGEFVVPELLNRANEKNAEKIYLSYEQMGLHYNLLIKKS